MIDDFHGANFAGSNFYPSPFVWDGEAWPTVEHAYQAMKSKRPGYREAILSNDKPYTAKEKGQKVAMRQDWYKIRVSVMTQCVRAKFFQVPECAKWLLGTGDEELVEGNTWGDVFWGVCDGKGENHLGKILMQVRQELRDAGFSLAA